MRRAMELSLGMQHRRSSVAELLLIALIAARAHLAQTTPMTSKLCPWVRD